MTLYNVHLYREMRLFFAGIVAETPEQAAGIAADKTTGEAEYTEDCDGEDLAALVDIVGDDQFQHSVIVDFLGRRLLNSPAKPVPGRTLTIQERAVRCQQAITAYSDDDTYTNLVDFIADAMHWCRLNGHRHEALLETAAMHFDAEITGDDILENLNQLPTTERILP